MNDDYVYTVLNVDDDEDGVVAIEAHAAGHARRGLPHRLQVFLHGAGLSPAG